MSFPSLVFSLFSLRSLGGVPALVAAMVASIVLPAGAAENGPPPQGVVSLSASATVDVTKDLLSVALTTSREGADAATVQTQLKQALDVALTEARKVASPGRLELHAGNFSVFPRYSAKGATIGWQGSAELLIDGRDLQAIGQLTGRITTLSIARVSYDISRELRERSEAEVSAEAITRYRARAASYATQFGYPSFVIREVEVSTSDSGPSRPRPMMAMKALERVANDEPLPTEPGSASVTVSVSGSVQLTR